MKQMQLPALLLVGMTLSLAFSMSTKHAHGPVPIGDAIRDKLVKATMINNKGFSHFDKCLLLQLQNTGNSAIRVAVSPGTLVNPDDPKYQNLLVTEDKLITLNPGEQKNVPLYAMCTEPHDAAPGEEPVSYQLASVSPEPLQKIAGFIAQQNYHNSEGQQAVWCVAERRQLEEIAGYDTTAVRLLQQTVSAITGQPLPPKPRSNDYRRNYYASPTVMKVKVSGKYAFKFAFEKQVLIGMYNTQNVLVRELYKNEHEAPGAKTVEYAFDATVYTDPVYFMRLYVNGEKRMETRMDLK